MGLNRVAVGGVSRTMTQGSSCLATLGFGTESRWDSRTARDSASRSRFAARRWLDVSAATLHAEALRVADVADPRSEQSQRDWGLQPKVGVQRLPWVRVWKSNQRQRRCG